MHKYANQYWLMLSLYAKFMHTQTVVLGYAESKKVNVCGLYRSRSLGALALGVTAA